MNISYEGIGQTVVTAALADESITPGVPVRFTANATVSAAEAGKAIDGVVLTTRNGQCAVAVSGFVTLPITGDVAIGKVKLAADGKGGVKTATAGCETLVVAVENDTATLYF